MPVAAFLYTHILVVILFLILFIVKAALLFLNKLETLEKVKQKTKVLDMIFGTLILVTGGYLLFQYAGVPTWLVVKVVLVLIAIPLAIIGLKKQHKPLTAAAVILFLYVYGVAESKSLTMKKETPSTLKAVPQPVAIEEDTLPTGEGAPAISTEMSETALANAKQIYNAECESCHGGDGKKMLNNATDLSKSMLTLEERTAVILKGRGLMPAFEGKLNEQEAEELAAFTQMLQE